VADGEVEFVADRTLACSDCGKDFVFSEAEQAFFKERGFDHDPKRCVECRRGRRRKFQSRSPGGSGADQSRGDSRGNPRQDRPNGAVDTRPPRASTAEMHTTVCSSCSEETQVPFRPDGVRPVYCMPCLKQQTR